MQIGRGKTESAFGLQRTTNVVNDINTRGSGLEGDPIFGPLFGQKAKGWYTN